MSPRRRITAGGRARLRMPEAAPRSRWLPMVGGMTALVVVAALSLSAYLFVSSVTAQRAAVRNAAVVDFVRSFITAYASPDPFNANAYTDRILALGTGEFAKLYSERINEAVIRVAQSEPGVGTVQEVGVERWNPDGSADVLAVANTATKLPNGTRIDDPIRWKVTAVKEGDQWKVSNLMQVL